MSKLPPLAESATAANLARRVDQTDALWQADRRTGALASGQKT